MKRTAFYIAMSVIMSTTVLVGCHQLTSPVSPVIAKVEHNAQAAQFSSQFIEQLWQLAPTWALYNGYHKYDHILVIPNDASRQRSLDFIQRQRQLLAKIDRDGLNANQQIDMALITNTLDSMQWEITTFKSWQWQPSNYNVAGGFAQIINGQYAPLEQRLNSVLERLHNVPRYYQAARASIVRPTLEHTQLAIKQNSGTLAVFSDELIASALASGLPPEDKMRFKHRVLEARQAVMSHIQWLEKLQQQLIEHGARSFRIGSELYEQKFSLDIQSHLSAKQLYHKALAEKQLVLTQMTRLTEQLWPSYFPTQALPGNRQMAIAQLIEELSVKHVQREDFVDEIRQQIPALERFVIDNDLISLDKNKPLVVRQTPEYMRGFAGASISAPGPYDKHANTYYNVTPLDHMSEHDSASYLREYNHWILQILNIHEAVPGHYTQLVYANMSPSLVKSLFGNGAMIEGWAVYCERMMLEQGYGEFEPQLWLMYYKWNLRVITNTILDYEIHNKNLTREQGLTLMMEGAFQQRAEAQSKWHRATVSQVQLTSYYSGYRDIYDLRQEYKALKGSQYQIKEFHEQFLSYGSAPVKFVRQLMSNNDE